MSPQSLCISHLSTKSWHRVVWLLIFAAATWRSGSSQTGEAKNEPFVFQRGQAVYLEVTRINGLPDKEHTDDCKKTCKYGDKYYNGCNFK